ncbi:MAG TPA: PDZ domain-containing protein [Gemmataceae bacterium]|nr:PDZ domain-containing protein [Gemmataceae bacterium]
MVQIETQGGTEMVASGPRMPGAPPGIRLGTGPTTGLIVHADGYVISSAFNFASKPQSILVAVPGHKERYVAEIVANDQTRMLTLLKLIGMSSQVPVPVAVPKSELRIGQTALAVGRTLTGPDRPMPSVSVGIISALNRIWGRAIQTDAKVSPTNYGGPLIDLEGRVIGILVPASPRGEGETAGLEWYDSGIGFAIPLEDVNAVLERLKQGKELNRGLLGITWSSQNLYGAAPAVGTVAPGSPADKAGFRPGDVIKEVDGKPVANIAQVMHALGTKYEGDTVAVKLLRGKQEINHPKLTLGSAKATFGQAVLGILPLRDDPELGVEVRYVYPKSPADAAGLKAGDRILKVGPATGMGPLRAFSGRDQLAQLLASVAPGTEIKLEVVRKANKKTEAVTVKVAEADDVVPEALPETASAKKALEARKPAPGMPPPPPPPAKPDPKKKPETGLIQRTNEGKDRTWSIYVPEDYDPNIAYGVVLWLHPQGKGKDSDFEDVRDAWEDYCSKNHLILVMPRAEGEGWVASESDFVLRVLNEVLGQYTVDRRRVVAHGMGIGGQMAFYVGFHARDTIRGVATTGSVLTGQPKEKQADRPLNFFVVAGGKDPLAKAIAETKAKLAEHKYGVIHREIPNMGHQYLDLKTPEELVRWIDSLDRL